MENIFIPWCSSTVCLPRSLANPPTALFDRGLSCPTLSTVRLWGNDEVSRAIFSSLRSKPPPPGHTQVAQAEPAWEPGLTWPLCDMFPNWQNKNHRVRVIATWLFRCAQRFVSPWAPDSALLISGTSENSERRHQVFYKINSSKGMWGTDFGVVFFSSLAKELPPSSFFVHLSYFLQQHLCSDLKMWQWPLHSGAFLSHLQHWVRKMGDLLGLGTLEMTAAFVVTQALLVTYKTWDLEDNTVFKLSWTTPGKRRVEGSPGPSLILSCRVSLCSVYTLMTVQIKKNPKQPNKRRDFCPHYCYRRVFQNITAAHLEALF